MSTAGTGLPAPLETGYRRFRAGRYALEHERYRRLGEGAQHPAAMVVACSDSRSGPETIFDAGPGELFVVRNVAALVPVYAPDAASHGASAALEYAVRELAVGSIVVMGHGRCGGIRAAVETPGSHAETDFIGPWVAGIRALAAEGPLPPSNDPARPLLALERRSVERSIENLRTFPWIASREAAGQLGLHGAWFDIALGELHALTDGGWARVEEG